MTPTDLTPAPAQLRARWTFVATRADALAWETLPRERVGWRAFAFILWIGAAGAWPVLVSDRLGFEEGGGPFLLVAVAAGLAHWAVAGGVARLAAQLRAARRRRRPTEIRVEDRGDHLAVAEGPAERPTREITLPFDRMRQVFATTTHLMVDCPPEVLILPASAFADRAALAATAEEWDRRSLDATRDD